METKHVNHRVVYGLDARNLPSKLMTNVWYHMGARIITGQRGVHLWGGGDCTGIWGSRFGGLGFKASGLKLREMETVVNSC